MKESKERSKVGGKEGWTEEPPRKHDKTPGVQGLTIYRPKTNKKVLPKRYDLTKTKT